jgi:hypothetical protein
MPYQKRLWLILNTISGFFLRIQMNDGFTSGLPIFALMWLIRKWQPCTHVGSFSAAGPGHKLPREAEGNKHIRLQ